MSEMKETTLADKNYRPAGAGVTQPAYQLGGVPSVGDASLLPRNQATLAYKRQYNLARITQIIWLVTGVLESVFAIRLLLKLMAANPAAGFATFIYNMTAVFLTPFFGLTATPSVNGSVLEISTLIAMLVYALLAWGVVRVLWITFERPLVQ